MLSDILMSNGSEKHIGTRMVGNDWFSTYITKYDYAILYYDNGLHTLVSQINFVNWCLLHEMYCSRCAVYDSLYDANDFFIYYILKM